MATDLPDNARRFQLCNGPQDGAHVIVYEPFPIRIFVGPKWMGDGNASWGREKCDRFPVCYVLDMTADKYSLLV